MNCINATCIPKHAACLVGDEYKQRTTAFDMGISGPHLSLSNGRVQNDNKKHLHSKSSREARSKSSSPQTSESNASECSLIRTKIYVQCPKLYALLPLLLLFNRSSIIRVIIKPHSGITQSEGSREFHVNTSPVTVLSFTQSCHLASESGTGTATLL